MKLNSTHLIPFPKARKNLKSLASI